MAAGIFWLSMVVFFVLLFGKFNYGADFAVEGAAALKFSFDNSTMGATALKSSSDNSIMLYGKFGYGADFAVEGETALKSSFGNRIMGVESSVSTNNSSLSKEIDEFMTHLTSICTDYYECFKTVRHAIFLVQEFESRDYYSAFLEARESEIQEMVNTLLPKVVVRSIKHSVNSLIDSGAWKTNAHKDLHFGPLNNGEFPLWQGRSKEKLLWFQKVFADYFNALVDVLYIQWKTCHGGGVTTTTITCSDPKQHIRLDEANKFMVERILAGSFVHPKALCSVVSLKMCCARRTN